MIAEVGPEASVHQTLQTRHEQVHRAHQRDVRQGRGGGQQPPRAPLQGSLWTQGPRHPRHHGPLVDGGQTGHGGCRHGQCATTNVGRTRRRAPAPIPTCPKRTQPPAQQHVAGQQTAHCAGRVLHERRGRIARLPASAPTVPSTDVAPSIPTAIRRHQSSFESKHGEQRATLGGTNASTHAASCRRQVRGGEQLLHHNEDRVFHLRRGCRAHHHAADQAVQRGRRRQPHSTPFATRVQTVQQRRQHRGADLGVGEGCEVLQDTGGQLRLGTHTRADRGGALSPHTQHTLQTPLGQRTRSRTRARSRSRFPSYVVRLCRRSGVSAGARRGRPVARQADRQHAQGRGGCAEGRHRSQPAIHAPCITRK